MKTILILSIFLNLYSCSESSETSSLVKGSPSSSTNNESSPENENSEDEAPTETSDISISSLLIPAAGTYAEGSELLFQIRFSAAVDISGSPRLSLNIGGTIKNVVYSSGSGSDAIEFSYIVEASDNDSDGVNFQSFQISLAGGSIQDENGLDLASLSLADVIDPLTGVIIDNSTGITAPDIVTGVTTAPTANNNELSLAWQVPANNGTAISSYIVQYREQGQSTWNSVAPNPTINQALISGLTEGATYEIRVAANNGLIGPYSSTSEVEIFDILSMNPIAWLSATNITNGGTEPSNGDRIAAWKDLTGVATDATENNTSNQPLFETNVQNGLPAVRFDGTQNRGLEGSFVRTNNGGLTVILVGAMDTNTVRKAFFEFYQEGSPTSGSNSRRGFFFTYGFGEASTNYFLDDSGFNIWVAYDTGTHSTQWENGTNIYTDNPNHFGRTDFSGNGIYVLGDDQTGGDRLSGYIGEFLVFDKELSTEEIEVITTYLKNKWNTP